MFKLQPFFCDNVIIHCIQIILTAFSHYTRLGVRCNVVVPGVIETPMTAAVPDKVKQKVGIAKPHDSYMLIGQKEHPFVNWINQKVCKQKSELLSIIYICDVIGGFLVRITSNNQVTKAPKAIAVGAPPSRRGALEIDQLYCYSLTFNCLGAFQKSKYCLKMACP